MKKTLLLIIAVVATLAFNTASAQWCKVTNSIPINPSAGVGFGNPDSIACAVQGIAYNDTIYFQMYSAFNFQGQHNIDSVTIDTIYNLPCGLCWSLNKASRTYAAGEFGNIYLTGTTSDAVGQYNWRMIITAYLSGAGGVGEQIPPSLVDAAGIKEWSRVAATAGSCTPVDTSATASNQTANANCPAVGINEVSANVAFASVVPNPVNSTAVLSFSVEKESAYTIKITDITGQVVSVKQIHAVPGVNNTSIERGKLSAGVYFISLTDGVSAVTRKFVIAD